MLEAIDLSGIKEENAHQLIVRLLNLIEDLSADLRDAQAETQRLRDENNRLKGEQGKPNIKANKPKPPQADHSSEKERRKPKQHKKRRKKAAVQVHREQTLEVDKASLPVDAEFKGYEDVVVQDVLFRADNVCFHKEKYWASSTGQTYLAELPRGYAGQFGPGIKALALTLYFGGGMSEPKIRGLYENGVQISAGELSNLLIKDQEPFHAEKDAVYEAGLRSSPWQHTDNTSTRVNGQNQHCHIVCNPLYTIYCTTPRKDRLSVLDVLRNGRQRVFRLNDEALGYLAAVPLSKAARNTLLVWRSEQDLDEATFLNRLDTQFPNQGVQQRQAILGAAAVAAYHAEVGMPIVRLLVCDDAPQFNWLTEEMGLCWIHEGRHYKKQLTPVVPHHRELLDDFLKQFWDLYDRLLTYRQHPNPEDCVRLEAEFDRLFATCTGYDALDARIATTRGKKGPLLMVLKHPEIPLHNNPAELEARQRVRKRDVSFGPRTQDGANAWDTFMSLAATTRKLGISFYEYVHDRISKMNQIPSLASLIESRAGELALGASWSAA